MPNITSFITRYVPEAVRSRIDASADLSELGINPFDRFYSMPIALEEAFGIELADKDIGAWVTVRDVERSVGALVGEMA